MDDEGQAPHVDESDADLEQRLGLRSALLTLWNPSGQPVAVSWDDSSIITADDQTRFRLTQTHSVIHALLRGEHAEAMRRLASMSSLMTVFTALRSLTLASELLWKVPAPTWQGVLADAQTQVLAMVADNLSETLTGAAAIRKAIRRNVHGDDQQTILDCIDGTASTLSHRARLGLGGFGVAVFVAALKATSSSTPGELKEEHAALLVAMARGQTVTHRDGRLVIDG